MGEIMVTAACCAVGGVIAGVVILIIKHRLDQKK